MTDPFTLRRDIRLDPRDHEFRPLRRLGVDRSQRITVSNRSRPVVDLATVHGRANLAQAIVVRLLTPVGELAPLGHPLYGSRLHELIGRPNSSTVRNLARLYVLESLAREPRIARILEVTATEVPPSRGATRSPSPATVLIGVRVLPIDSSQPLDLDPFALEL